MFALRRLCRFRNVIKGVPKHGFDAVSRRNGGTGQCLYRRPALKPNPFSIPSIISYLAGFGMWYWILYHLATQSEHLTGHFPYPDPSKWTDEELGIPPDDEE